MKKNPNILIMIGLLAMLALAACRSEGPSPTATLAAIQMPAPFRTARPATSTSQIFVRRATSTPLPTGTAVPSLTPLPPTPTATLPPAFIGVGVPGDPLVDTFADPESGWVEEGGSDFGYGYFSGSYLVYNNLDNAEVCASRSRDFTNMIIDVDASKIRGPGSAYFGVTCRKTEIGYYTLAINARGEYFIYRTWNEDRKLLLSGFAPIIRQGAATNHLTASCIGPTLTLAVNGSQVAQVTNYELGANDFVGLLVGTSGEGGAEIVFDNFHARSPEDN